MVKSKRTFDAYLNLFAFLCFLILLLYFLYVNIGRKLDIDILLIPCPLLFLTLFFGQYVWKGFKRISLDENEENIIFCNPVFLVRKKFKINSFQGYVTGRAKRGKQGMFKIIWLVKDDKLTNRIDEMFVSNINELEIPIKNTLQYLGYQQITFKKRVCMLLKNVKIDAQK